MPVIIQHRKHACIAESEKKWKIERKERIVIMIMTAKLLRKKRGCKRT